jgi:hypothetical protein
MDKVADHDLDAGRQQLAFGRQPIVPVAAVLAAPLQEQLVRPPRDDGVIWLGGTRGRWNAAGRFLT